MKKLLLVMLLALLSSIMFAGISQAGQCICIEDNFSYYDSSSLRYSGDIVHFNLYHNDACKLERWQEVPHEVEIDCARRITRSYVGSRLGWTEWSSFAPESTIDVARQKLCR